MIFALLACSSCTNKAYRICFGCADSTTGYDMITRSQNDITNLLSIVPNDKTNIFVYFEKYPTVSLDLNNQDFTQKSLELVGKGPDYYSTDSLKVSLGTVKSLFFNKLQFSIIKDISATNVIDEFISVGSRIVSGVITYSAISNVFLAIPDYNNFGPKTGYNKSITILVNKDSGQIIYNSDGWILSSSDYIYGTDTVTVHSSKTPYFQVAVQTPIFKMNVASSIDSVTTIPIKMLANKTDLEIGTGWDCIEKLNPIYITKDTRIKITSKSFTLPVNITLVHVDIVLTTDININCTINVNDYDVTIGADDYSYYSVKVNGTKMSIGGTSSLLGGNKFNGLHFQRIILYVASIVKLPLTRVNTLQILEGAKLTMTEKLESDSIYLSWDVDQYPMIDMNAYDINVSSIYIMYTGYELDDYNFIIGKRIDLIKSSKCSELKNIATFSSDIPEFDDSTSIVTLSCSPSGILQLKGPESLAKILSIKELNKNNNEQSITKTTNKSKIVSIAGLSTTAVVLAIVLLVKMW